MIDSLERLLEQHAWAALRISGAEQSAWNGQIIEADDGVLGLAHWDGTLHLDRDFILDPLQDLYRRPGESRTDAELTRCRDALLTLLHEQSHFLGPAGATQEAAHAAFKLPGGRPLEEGVAEAWAHDHLDDYLRELEIDKVAPGIVDIRTEPSYAAFVPAVRLFTAHLDRQTGAPPGETLHLLNRQTAEGQWPMAIALIYNSTRLPDLVPSTDEPPIRHHLEETLRNSFKSLELYEPFPRGFAASRSHAATTRLLTTLHQSLTTTEHHHTPPPPRTHLHLPPPTVPTPTRRRLTTRTPTASPASTTQTPLISSAGRTPPPTPTPLPTASATNAPHSIPKPPRAIQATPTSPSTTAMPPSPLGVATANPQPDDLAPALASTTAMSPAPLGVATTDPQPHVLGLAPTSPATAAQPAPAHHEQRAASTHSPQAAAIHHAFAGLTPPTARAPAPPDPPPQPAATNTARQLEPDLRTLS
ncbi:hypothetical protein [Kribbella sp. CA-294648]|uniref:hypothetical protein n=1 Tax=Kribbella sp. CA-294648 TaxID=3239948 RepID=UPI003D8C8482